MRAQRVGVRSACRGDGRDAAPHPARGESFTPRTSLPLSAGGRGVRIRASARASRVSGTYKGTRTTLLTRPRSALPSLGHPLPQGERENRRSPSHRTAPEGGMTSPSDPPHPRASRGDPRVTRSEGNLSPRRRKVRFALDRPSLREALATKQSGRRLKH